jgi:hypothetical protein
LVACLACTTDSVAKPWTDVTGKHTIEAEFLDCVDGIVQLRTSDGSTIAVPLQMFCESDRRFIRTRRGTPGSIAAALPPWAGEAKVPAESAGGVSLSGETSRPQTSTFVLGEPVQLTFTVANLAVRRKRLKLQLAVANENGKVLHQAELPVEPEMDGTWRTTVDTPHDRLGFYRVHARLSNGVELAQLGSRRAGFLTYCIVPDPAKRRLFKPGETFFSMAGGFHPKVSIAPYLGIRWLLGRYEWNRMEPNRPGEFVEQRAAASREGKQFPPGLDSADWTVDGKRWQTYLIPALHLAPQWAVVPGTMNKGNCTGTLSPVGEKAWRGYCLAAGKAFAEDHPDLAERLYQVTWEPDVGFRGTDEDLIRIYQIAYPALHEADPKARVLGPTAHVGVQWNHNMLSKGLGRYVDGWTVHASVGFPPERAGLIQQVRALKMNIRQYVGRDLPVYGTEQGLHNDENPGKELDQACGLLRGNLIMMGEGSRLNITFFIHDGEGEPGYGYFYNLNPKVRTAGTDKIGPKPVAPAYAAQSFLLEGYRSAGPIDWLGETIWGYACERGDDIVLALWDCGDRPRQVSLPTGVDQVDVYDWMGNKQTVATANQRLRLTLGPEPIYVTGASAQVWGSKAKKPLSARPLRSAGASRAGNRTARDMLAWSPAVTDSPTQPASPTAPESAPTGGAPTSASPSTGQTPVKPQKPPVGDPWTPWQDLFDGRSLDDWKPMGTTHVENGTLVLEGERFAGVATTRSVPKIGYEVTVEAMRFTGKDFGSLVFPFHEMHCGLTVGGFTGDVVGFGNVNGTGPGGPQSPVDRRIAVEANRWYTVRLRVTEERIIAWLDNQLVITLNPHGCTFEALGPPLRPLGVFAFGGKATIHSIRLRQLKSPSAGFPEDFIGSAMESWVKSVAVLRPEEQLEAVRKKLMELNPGFDGKLTDHDGKGPPNIYSGAVTQLGFVTGNVIDISPLRALTGLKAVSCAGGPSRSALTDLSPLAGIQLAKLNCSRMLGSDLSPLKGMPLTRLDVSGSRVTDLSPLRGMPLTLLWIGSTPVSDLSPLEGMPLTNLGCNSCAKISDLSPLRGMPLEFLDLCGAHVTELSPLKGMPLRTLYIVGVPISDLSPLRGCRDLRRIDMKGTKVTAADIKRLQQALPQCKINR